jgi:uncharacterized protein YndB with AHSA1/START domain
VTASPARTDAAPELTEEELVITRVFDAPRQRVWKAWTEADALRRWWGPRGFTMNVCKLDFRPDGMFHYSMRTPDGRELWGRFVYREIVKPERIVFVNSFADQSGDIVRNPWSADWPLEVLNTQTFSERGGKTTLVLRGAPLNANATERKAFADGRKSMQQGFAGTLDQLAEFLATN